jgi:hypothetical protein
MKMAAALIVFAFAAALKGESPLRPVPHVDDLPPELRNCRMLAVFHQWSPLDRPWKTVSHGTFPIGSHRIIERDRRVLVYDPKSRRIVPAQIEFVARRNIESPEVLEAIFSDEVALGSNVRCLFLKDGPQERLPLEQGPWTLIADKEAVVVRMTDGLGVRYEARLFEHGFRERFGPQEYVERFFSKLAPVDSSAPAIPQPLRFHSFVTARRGEPYFDVRVLVENCSSENPAGDFPFVSLELGAKGQAIAWDESLLPMERTTAEEKGWTWATAIPPNADGKCHVAPDHFQMRLRFTLAAPERKEVAAVRMQHEPLYVAVPGLDLDGKPTASWNSVAAFGPTRVGIPRGDGPHAAIRDRVDREVEAWRTGHPLLKRLGPWWVHGEVGGEAPSGVEIAFTCPWAARFIQSGGAPSAWRLMNAAFDANLRRQNFGFWRDDGLVWTFKDAMTVKDGVHCTPELNIHSGRPHPTPYCKKFGRPEREATANYKAIKQVMDDPNRTASYVKELAQYTNYDDEHLCRFTQYLFPLVWLGNDPCAKALLEVQAAMSMASSNPYPTGPGREEQTSGSLAELHRIAAEKPGWGSPHLARGAGWNAQAVVAGLASSRGGGLAQCGLDWLAAFSKLPVACQLPTGGVHRTDQDQRATFDLNGDGKASADERDLPVEHGSIYMQGIYRFAGCRSVLMQLDPNRQAAEIAALEKAMRGLDRYFIDFAWDDDANLPGWNNAVVVKSRPNEIVTKKRRGTVWGGSPDAAFYFDDILAEAYRLSGDERFLEKIAAMHGGELNVERDGGNSIHAAWVLETVTRNRKRSTLMSSFPTPLPNARRAGQARRGGWRDAPARP